MSADPKESSVPLAEISQAPSAFEQFLDRNQKGIAVFAVLLAVGAGALVVVRGLETNRQEDAGAALVKAEDLAGFQSVVDGHADTKAAGSAMLLLANSQWTDGKKDESVGTLQKFISTFPDHAAIPTAKASLGAKLMAQGKSGEAAKVFDEIAADPAAAYIAPFALISLGDIAKSEGDATKAEASYVKVKNDFPASNFVETATRRIATLNAKPPVEIAPPPVTEKPAAAVDPMEAIKSSLPPGVTVTPAPAPEAPAPAIEVAPANEGTPNASPQEEAPDAGNESAPEPALPEHP